MFICKKNRNATFITHKNIFEGHGELKNVVSMLRNEYAVGENSEKEWVELMERVKKEGI